MNIKLWGAVLLCLLLGSLSAGVVTAQRSKCASFTEPIEYGDTAKGEINDDTVYVFYCFEGQRGDDLVIDLETTDGDLDPYMILSDKSVEEIYAQNDNVSSRNENSHIEFTLENDAIYIITVTRFDGDSGRTDGEYKLSLESGSQTSSNNNHTNSIEGGQCPNGSNLLLPGYELSSTITDDIYLRTYCFYGIAGTEYRITAETTKDDLDTAVFVAPPDLSDVIDTNDNASSRTTDSRLDFTPETDGVYLIIVSRADVDKGKTSGEYVVSLENRTTGDPETCPDALSFPTDGVQLERLDETYLHVYCFNGTEDERVTFNAEARRGDLDMTVFITQPNLDTVEQVESKDKTLELTAKIPADGPYLIIVFDLTGLGLIDMTFDGGSGSSTSNNSSNDDTTDNTPQHLPDNSHSTSAGDCESQPLSFLLDGNWSSTSSTGKTEMDFACDGTVTVTVNGKSSDSTFTFENDTLTLNLNDGDVIVEGVLLTRTALIGTSDGQAFMLLNRAR